MRSFRTNYEGTDRANKGGLILSSDIRGDVPLDLRS